MYRSRSQMFDRGGLVLISDMHLSLLFSDTVVVVGCFLISLLFISLRPGFSLVLACGQGVLISDPERRQPMHTRVALSCCGGYRAALPRRMVRRAAVRMNVLIGERPRSYPTPSYVYVYLWFLPAAFHWKLCLAFWVLLTKRLQRQGGD